MTQQIPTQEGPPHCYGDQWDNNAVECSGGFDPGYRDKVNGSNMRKRCDWFDSCKTRVVLKRTNAGPQIIPPTQLLRQPPQQNWQPPVQPQWQQPAQQPWRPTTMQPWQQPQAAAPQQWFQQQPQQHPQWQQPQQYTQQHPMVQTAPIQMMPVQYQMPTYLTAPEPFIPGEPIWYPFAREAGRSMLKAFGHSVASFFDRWTFGRQ